MGHDSPSGNQVQEAEVALGYDECMATGLTGEGQEGEMRMRGERRRWRGATAAVAVVAVIAAVGGCPTGVGNGNGTDPETYTVSFERQGGIGGTTSVTATYGSPMPPATAPTKAGVVFDGYYTGPDGTGAQYYTAAMESARNWDIPANTELIANWVYEIGASGPAGGIVFYDKGEYTSGWRYLEAAPASTEWENKPWGGYGTEVGAGAQGTAIGTGAANTEAIVTSYGENEPDAGRADYAAKLCANLSYGGGYSDWFLPSRYELNEMYVNLHVEGLGSFASAGYWCSSEYDSLFAADQSFVDGGQGGYYKNVGYRVRAARAF